MFRYTPTTIPHNILVVGCGGTGSRLVPLLAQFLRSLMKEHNPRGWLGTPNIALCDFDTIEEKNLLRQNFIKSDIGKNKEVVLAERYGRAYGMNILPITTAIDSCNDIHNIFYQKFEADVRAQPLMIIMCVDSVEARRKILGNAFHLSVNSQTVAQNIFIIDSGNEDNFGQVNFFNPIIPVRKDEAAAALDSLPKLITSYVDSSHMPMDVDHYLNMVAMPGQGSCADLDQTLAINAIIATTIMGIVQNYYYRKPMTYNKVHIGLDGSSFTTFNTIAELKRKALPSSLRSYVANVFTTGSGAQRERAAQMFSVNTGSSGAYTEVSVHSAVERILEAEAAQAKAIAKAAADEKKAEAAAKRLAKEMEKAAKAPKLEEPFVVNIEPVVISTAPVDVPASMATATTAEVRNTMANDQVNIATVATEGSTPTISLNGAVLPSNGYNTTITGRSYMPF